MAGRASLALAAIPAVDEICLQLGGKGHQSRRRGQVVTRNTPSSASPWRPPRDLGRSAQSAWVLAFIASADAGRSERRSTWAPAAPRGHGGDGLGLSSACFSASGVPRWAWRAPCGRRPEADARYRFVGRARSGLFFFFAGPQWRPCTPTLGQPRHRTLMPCGELDQLGRGCEAKTRLLPGGALELRRELLCADFRGGGGGPVMPTPARTCSSAPWRVHDGRHGERPNPSTCGQADSSKDVCH